MVQEECSSKASGLPFGACEQSPWVEAAGGLAVVTAGGSPAQVAIGEVGYLLTSAILKVRKTPPWFNLLKRTSAIF
jgi:hypothetical protein